MLLFLIWPYTGNMKMHRMLSICLKKFAIYLSCDVPPLLEVCFGTSISSFCHFSPAKGSYGLKYIWVPIRPVLTEDTREKCNKMLTGWLHHIIAYQDYHVANLIRTLRAAVLNVAWNSKMMTLVSLGQAPCEKANCRKLILVLFF